jgi:hypothetical protein
LGAVSVFFVVGDLAAVLESLAVATGFLTALPDDLPGALLEDGALRLEEDLVVVVDFPVTAFAFDPGLAAGFAGVLVLVAVFEVFEAGLFWMMVLRDGTKALDHLGSPLLRHRQLWEFSGRASRVQTALNTLSQKHFKATKICNLWEARRCLSQHQRRSPYSAE